MWSQWEFGEISTQKWSRPPNIFCEIFLSSWGWWGKMKNVQVGGGRSTFFCSFGLPMACFAQMDHEWNFSSPPTSPLVFNLEKRVFSGRGRFFIRKLAVSQTCHISGNKKTWLDSFLEAKNISFCMENPLIRPFPIRLKKVFLFPGKTFLASMWEEGVRVAENN